MPGTSSWAMDEQLKKLSLRSPLFYVGRDSFKHIEELLKG